MNRFIDFVRSYWEWLASAGLAVALVVFLLIMSGCTRTIERDTAPTPPATTTTIVEIAPPETIPNGPPQFPTLVFCPSGDVVTVQADCLLG